MCEDICLKYNDLEYDCLYRKTFSRISLICKKNYLFQKNDSNVEYIKRNLKYILGNKKAPFRTKVAAILIKINIGLFKIFWKFYCKITNRKR